MSNESTNKEIQQHEDMEVADKEVLQEDFEQELNITAKFEEVNPKEIIFARKEDNSLFWNARQSIGQEYLAKLKGSIQKTGLIEEIVVRQLPNGKLQVVCGECRLRSILSLIKDNGNCYDLKTATLKRAADLFKRMTAKVLYNCSDIAAAKFSVSENIERKNLTEYELMDYCLELSKRKNPDGTPMCSTSQICWMVSRSSTWVSQTMSLYKLSDEAKELLITGELPRTVALNLLQVREDKLSEVLKLARLFAVQDLEEEKSQIEREVITLEEQLEEADIEVSVADLSEQSDLRRSAKKTRSLIDKKLTEAQNKRKTIRNRRPRLNTDVLTRATDSIDGARKGKRKGMSQKAVRLEINRVKGLLTANKPVTNSQLGMDYSNRDVELILLGMQMVLGESNHRNILVALAERYSQEGRRGWEGCMDEMDTGDYSLEVA